MSQLWPDLLRITLCPDQVVLERGRFAISLRGVESLYLEPEIIPVEPRHEPTLWAAPLAVLGIALDGLPERLHEAEVILSNHFVSYPLLQADGPRDHGPVAGNIDVELEAALQTLLARHRCRLGTLQPRLLAFGNYLLEELQGEPGWVVLVEEGLASIGLVRDSEIVRCRNLYMWPASSVELLSLLDQEARLAGLLESPRNLLLWRRDESDEIYLALGAGWQITRFGEPSTNAVPPQAATAWLPLDGARA